MEYITKSKGIDSSSPGPEGRLFRILAIEGGSSYREASLRVAGLGNISDLFESLWDEYETAMDKDRPP